MKFLDANGLALFTKKIFNKFVSNVSGADNKITITKGDGTTIDINLNEVIKTDVIGENPPDDDNTLKIASTSWVQTFVTTMVFKLISKLAETEETSVSSSGSFLGANWLIAQNGYIYFGKLFGSITIQFGVDNITDLETTGVYAKEIIYPIAFKHFAIPIFIPTTNIPTAFRKFMIDVFSSNNKFKARADNSGTIFWIAVGA